MLTQKENVFLDYFYCKADIVPYPEWANEIRTLNSDLTQDDVSNIPIQLESKGLLNGYGTFPIGITFKGKVLYNVLAIGIDGLSKREINCHLVLSCLSLLTSNWLQPVDDSVLIENTGLSQEELRSCLSKIGKKYIDGGKGATTITDDGREFWENGGFKQQPTLVGMGDTHIHFPDNKGQVAIGNNQTFGDNKPKINSESDEGVSIAKKGFKLSKVQTIVGLLGLLLLLAGWLLSYYKIWPFH